MGFSKKCRRVKDTCGMLVMGNGLRGTELLRSQESWKKCFAVRCHLDVTTDEASSRSGRSRAEVSVTLYELPVRYGRVG